MADYSATHSNTSLFDHFLGAAIAGEFAGLAENSGTVAIAPGVEGGVARLTTGALSGNRAQLFAGLNWRADRGGIHFEARVRSNTSVATRGIFIGLTDTVAQEFPIEVGASQALTTNASDGVGYVFDTNATVDNIYTASVKGDLDGAIGSLVTARAPVVDTWDVYGIKVNKEGGADFFLNGVWQSHVDNAVTPTVLLTPVVALITRAASAAVVDVDYVHVGGRTI